MNRGELNKLLRQRRLQLNNAKKKIFPIVDQFVERERNKDSEIDWESLLEMLQDTEKEATELSHKMQKIMIDANELMEHLKKKKAEFNMSLKKAKRKLKIF